MEEHVLIKSTDMIVTASLNTQEITAKQISSLQSISFTLI